MYCMMVLTFVQSVFVFLVILTSGLQYVIQGINYKKDLERIERFIGEARLAAWGSKMIPIDGQRKVRDSSFLYV